MKKRDPIVVAILTVVTLGIYSLFWFAESKDSIHEKLTDEPIPSMWFFLLPFGGYWWVWKYSEAIELYTKNKIKRNDTFILFLIATMAGGFAFQYPDSLSDNTGWFVAVAAVGTVMSLVIFSIFPAVMQSKYNSLSTKK